jgi:hypothetical protein
MDSPSEVPSVKITKDSRYYQLHAEERKRKYHTNPEVIRKREEREKRKAEKEAEKEAARAERQHIKEEKIKLAIQTSKAKK